MKFLSNQKLATRIGIITTAVTLTGMILLWIIVSNNVASIVKSDITNQMTDAVESRASIINDYVTSAEEYMAAFALGSEVHDLLADPDNPALLSKAQQYTEDFASVKGIFEGLYVATPDTHVLTHTSHDAIGITTRSGDSLVQFQDTILARRELTNLGIMKSPGTGSMILSMYYPIYEADTCIGYVGAGVYASQLMDVLLGLEIKGLPNSEYVFLNVDTGVYLYHQNEELLNTETTVRFVVGILCAIVEAVIILITFFILHRQGRELMRVESAIRHLGNLDLSADQELESFHGRRDEIGMIAHTTHNLCSCLRKTIDDIGRILGEMADGNIAVDVTRNESYYIGDFKVLSESLKTIRSKLTNLMRDISRVANQVDSGAYQLSSGVQTLSEGTMEQSVSVSGLVTHVTDLTSQINDSAIRCSNASELVGKANGYADEADEKMAQLTVATKNINQSSVQIGSIIKTIEDIAFQTNILALNASVEAARAGTAGKGFSVVADEVRSLASKSSQAAQNTNVLIMSSIQDIKTGSESTDQAISAMQVINDCIESIKTLMDEIALASVRQSEMITSVEDGIKDISKVVQANTTIAEESAEVSKELSNQANNFINCFPSVINNFLCRKKSFGIHRPVMFRISTILYPIV